MRLENSDTVEADAQTVYKIIRDQLTGLVPFLPNVGKIEVLSRKDLGGGRTEIVNLWHAKAEIPSVAKKFISPDILSWKDYAVWNDEEMAVEYRLEPAFGGSLFEVKGRNFLKVRDAKSSQLHLTCDVAIYPEKLPGVPRLLAGVVKPAVEELIKKILTPNLTSLASGVNGKLKQDQRR
ncbi:MAG: hypothetical protein AAB425_14625 [Bdellovibrionota bacterium]